MRRRAARCRILGVTAHLFEDRAKKILHRLPRAMVRLLVIGERGDMVFAGIGIGKTVLGAAIDIELPIGAGLAHLVLERLYLRWRCKWIVRSVAGQDPGLHLA